MSNREDAQTRRRADAQVAKAVLAVSLLCVCPSARLRAQVGHDPQNSPFRDVTTHQSLTPFVQFFGGNTAAAGVGAQKGTGVGGRFTQYLSGPIDLWVTVAYIQSARNVINPTKPAASRMTGPIDMRLISADLGIGINLTGRKTWHGLVPYIGASFGIVAPTESVTDTGGYVAGSNITFVPTIGVRMKISPSLGLMAEVRDNFIRYEWPLQYFFPKDAQNNAINPPVLDPLLFNDKQTTHNFSLSVGLTYHFNF